MTSSISNPQDRGEHVPQIDAWNVDSACGPVVGGKLAPVRHWLGQGHTCQDLLKSRRRHAALLSPLSLRCLPFKGIVHTAMLCVALCSVQYRSQIDHLSLRSYTRLPHVDIH